MPIVARPTTPISFSGILQPYSSLRTGPGRTATASKFRADRVSGLGRLRRAKHGNRPPSGPPFDREEPHSGAGAEPRDTPSGVARPRGGCGAEGGRRVLRSARRPGALDQERHARHRRARPPAPPSSDRCADRRVDGRGDRRLALRRDGAGAGSRGGSCPGGGRGRSDPRGGDGVHGFSRDRGAREEDRDRARPDDEPGLAPRWGFAWVATGRAGHAFPGDRFVVRRVGARGWGGLCGGTSHVWAGERGQPQRVSVRGAVGVRGGGDAERFPGGRDAASGGEGVAGGDPAPQRVAARHWGGVRARGWAAGGGEGRGRGRPVRVARLEVSVRGWEGGGRACHVRPAFARGSGARRGRGGQARPPPSLRGTDYERCDRGRSGDTWPAGLKEDYEGGDRDGLGDPGRRIYVLDLM